MDPNDQSPPDAGVKRRTVVGAAAWTAPAILLTVASPAAAASTGTITASPAPIRAGLPQSTALQLTPASADVPITLVVDPEGSVTWSPDIVTGPDGTASVLFSTDVTTAQTVTVTAVAPGYESTTFDLPIEAAPEGRGTISVVRGPSSISAGNVAPPITLALDPVFDGVPISLRSEPGDAFTFSPSVLSTDDAGQATFIPQTTIATKQSASIIASAPGYPDLTIPLDIIPNPYEYYINGGDFNYVAAQFVHVEQRPEGKAEYPDRPVGPSRYINISAYMGEVGVARTALIEVLTTDGRPTSHRMETTEWQVKRDSVVSPGRVQTLLRWAGAWDHGTYWIFVHWKGGSEGLWIRTYNP